MKDHGDPVLIVGSGPTGLAAALFLAERGIRSRIVDKAEGPSTTSRAQVVNPRALDLLAATGVSDAIVEEGRPIRGVRFHEGWLPLAEIELRDLPSKHVMTVLPQARTEALLAEALARHGIEPERNISFENLHQTSDGVEVTLAGATEAIVQTNVLLGADGAHSAVRDAVGIGFQGHGFPEEWPLYDIHLEDPLDLEHAHVGFFDEGLVFMLAIRPGLWRVFSNLPDPLELLPPGSRPGEIEWQSSFHIGDKKADRLVEGRVVLAGDAAHIHSPIGARGMNLGIEDAYVFAACAGDALAGAANRLGDYQRLRHPIHAKVVGRMDKITTFARGRPGLLGALRPYLVPGLAGFGPLARAMGLFVSGLDEPVIKA